MGQLLLAPQRAGHSVRLAPRPPVLAGREQLLARLDALLAEGSDPGPRVVVLSGLAGAGKTSVALEYAHRHIAEVEVAWQLVAEDPAVLAAGFGDLAAQLGARDLIDARDPVASVHGVLAASSREWLLIFDNAPDRFSSDVAPVLVPLLNDQVAAGEALAALRRYSLVSLPVDRSVSVSRLVQTLTIGQMPVELAEAWRQATAAVIEAAIPKDADRPQSWPDFAALLAHAQAALTPESDGMARIANYLGKRGSYAAALELHKRALEVLEQTLGPEHLSTLVARYNLARWTGEAGDVAGARDQFEVLLPVFERVFGLEHPHSLAARHNFARWTGEAGDAAGARDQFAALLPVLEQLLGPDHQGTLTARSSLARWTGEAGNAAGGPRSIRCAAARP